MCIRDRVDAKPFAESRSDGGISVGFGAESIVDVECHQIARVEKTTETGDQAGRVRTTRYQSDDGFAGAQEAGGADRRFESIQPGAGFVSHGHGPGKAESAPGIP